LIRPTQTWIWSILGRYVKADSDYDPKSLLGTRILQLMFNCFIVFFFVFLVFLCLRILKIVDYSHNLNRFSYNVKVILVELNVPRAKATKQDKYIFNVIRSSKTAAKGGKDSNEYTNVQQ